MCVSTLINESIAKQLFKQKNIQLKVISTE